MQSAGVSLVINKTRPKFCFLSLGDGFPFVLIDYFGVCLLFFVWFVFMNLNFTLYIIIIAVGLGDRYINSIVKGQIFLLYHIDQV